MKLLVLGGGDSPEREVSLRSAANVTDAARQAGFDVSEVDPLYDPDVLKDLPKDVLVFPILHGAGGEDGIIQKQLEDLGLKFLGSDSQVSKVCFDKWRTRQTLQAADINMPKAERVNRESYYKSSLANQSHVLKVMHGGSSIGTLIVRKGRENSDGVKQIFDMENNAVLEELIEGHEITVPILDGKALPLIEIIPPSDEEFDYENKYNGRTQELCPPQSINDELQKRARALAEQVHSTMGARHLSRVDMMIDKDGKLYVLEINTMPGMTKASLYPKSALRAGLDMSDLVKKFAELTQKINA